MQTQIISKKSMKNIVTSDTNIIKVVEDSVILVDVAPEDVQELIVNENQVIIKLNNGEQITVENFNPEKSDLVFRNSNNEMFVLDFKNVVYNPLANIEILLEPGAAVGATILNNWLAGGALALGAVGVGVAVFDATNGSDKGSDNNIPPDSSDLINKATTAVEAAEDANQDLIDAIAAKNGVINPQDKIELDALKAIVDDLKAKAQTLVDALPAADAVKKAELDDRLDAINTTVPNVNDSDSDGTIDIVLPADNIVSFVPKVINPTSKLPTLDQQLDDKTAFAIANVGLGPVLSANLLTEVLKNSLEVSVDDGTVRNLTLKSQSGGVSIVSMYDLKVYRLDESTGEYKEYLTEAQWLKAYFLAGVSDNLNLSLPEGKYLIFLTPSVGVTLLTGYTLKVLNDIILDYNEVVSVEGEIEGNVISDVDTANGQDVLPSGTIVDSITVGSGSPISLISGSETSIEGKFGTLYINQDGSYRYEVKEDFKGPFGQIDEFTYTVKTTAGVTASAKLNISINNKVPELEPVQINETVVINPQPSITDQTGTIGKLTNVKVLDISLLDPVIKAEAVDSSQVMNFDVAENNVRELTFQGDGGGVSLTAYSLFIYKLNEDTNEYVQVHKIDNWYTVILGGRSDERTFKFTEGNYFAVTVPTGVNVLGGAGLYVRKDTLYDYSTVDSDSDYVGETSGKITLDPDSKIIIAGNENLNNASIQIPGQYGLLILDANGNYQYKVFEAQTGQSLPYGEIETFTYVIKDQDGETSLKTLTIKIDLAEANNDQIDSTISLENKNVIIQDDKILDVGAAQTNLNANFAVAKDTVSTVDISFETTVGLNNDRSINYVIKKSDGEIFKSGKIDVTTGKVLTLTDVPSGVYTIEAQLENTTLTYFSDSRITFSNTYLKEFTPVTLETITGDVSTNDKGLDSVSSYIVNGLSTSTYHGNPSVTVEGLYGKLLFKNDGSYEYTPSGKGFGADTFSYTVTTVGGTTSTASLVINVNKEFISSKFNDTFTGSDISDNLIYELLDATNSTGGNGLDTWSDFTVGNVQTNSNADKIDVSALLSGANENNISSYISYDKVKGVISIDRDGAGNQYNPTELLNIGPQSSDLTLEQLLQNGQIIY